VVYQQEQKDAKTTTLQQTAAKGAAPAAGTKAADKTKDAKPGAALPDTLEWPADAPRARSKAIAYAALFRAWGADYRGAGECQQAEGLGLRCRTSRGGLADLRQLNRPAVLQMRDDHGREFYATLTALEDKTATFAVGAETRSVAINALATQWSGHYTLLWRMPPGAHENIRPGERGSAVEWMSKQLAQLQGRVADAIKDPAFDDALARHVKQFQLAQGLVPDGAVGPQTLMHLSSVADQTAPKLLRGKEEK
jgi:general secretion pathway protein A